MRLRAYAALGVALAVAVVGVHCKTPLSCTQVGCSTVPVVELRVKLPPSELASDSLHLCHNELCIDGIVGTDPHAEEAAHGELRAIFFVEGQTAGWSTVSIRILPTSDAYLPDGDRYVVELRSPAGSVVASLDRNIIYAERYAPNGEACGGHCTSGTLRGYPESAPNLTCTSVSCQSGARFEVPISEARYYELFSGSLYACRNDVCTTNANRPMYSGPLDFFAGDLQGFTIETSLKMYASTGVATLTFLEDPSLLADGDVYALRRGPSPSDETIWQQTVTSYDERFPNGAACDVHPCRSVGLTSAASP
ncbi:MAG: hypothetical protein JWO86_626 [Myxococcaceae bacterium]|nr:hypothetical protein [Myxococcaceae bacterium]